eukprot:40401-Karenia_brevis.AAC.1
MGQRKTNPIRNGADEAAGPSFLVEKEVTSKESLELPARQGVSGSADDFVRGSVSFDGSNSTINEGKRMAKDMIEV